MTDLLAVLADLARGKAMRQINADLDEVLTAVRETGSEGEITLKIKCKPTGFDQSGNVTELAVSHTVSLKRPRAKIGASTFFVDNDGSLTRHNPDQLQIDLQPTVKQ